MREVRVIDDTGQQLGIMDQGSRVVTVEIHGQQYPIRSGLDPAYVAELAKYVDDKMQLALRESPAGDTLKLAVLAALNIADEYFRVLDDERRQNDQVASRAAALERVLDLALGLDGGRAHLAAR